MGMFTQASFQVMYSPDYANQIVLKRYWKDAMKIIFKILFFAACLPLFSIPSFADQKVAPNPETVQTNDGLIKAVHARGGLVMAIPPYWGRESTRSSFDPIARHIGHILENEVVLIVLKDYEIMVKRTAVGEVDIGVYGAALYVETKKRCPGLRYIATSVWKDTGKSIYFSYLITRKGSGLLSIQSLKGKSFAFGSTESTGGYRYPLAWMKENGIEPDTYFSNVAFLGFHNNVLDAIAQGRVDAGTVSPGPLKKAEKKYGYIFNRLRKFGPIPGTVVAVNGSLSGDLVQKITDALIFLPEQATKTKAMDFMGFKVLSDASYDRLRDVMEMTRE